jgi:cell division protein FtsA
MEKYIAAVDLGTKKITVLAGERTSSGKFHILAHHEEESRGIVQGEVFNNMEVGNVLKGLVEALKQQAGMTLTEVYVGVSGKHIRCIKGHAESKRNNASVEISKEETRRLEQDMRQTHTTSSSKVLEVVPQVYHLDNRRSVLNPVGVCGHQLEAEFCVLTGADSQMELIQRSVQRAGLKVKGLVLSPLASAEAVLHDDDKNMGVAVIDIGGGTTDVVVYYDDIVRRVAVIPFGGDIITEDIRHGCAISLRYAEQLKVQYGSCYSDLIKENPTYRIPGTGGGEVSRRTLTNIIEARMAEIIEAAVYEIDQSGYADRLNAGIVLTGGGAKLGEVTEFVKYKTGMKVRKGEPLFVTSDSDNEVKHGNYATAVGLLMKGCIEREPVVIEQKIFEDVTVNEPVTVNSGTKKRNGKRNIFTKISALPSLFDGLDNFLKDNDNET